MAEPNDAEKTNIRFIEEFIDGWFEDGFDATEQYPRYLAADAVVRMQDDMPAINGAQAAGQAIKSFMEAGGLVKSAAIDDIYARGPLVITIRRDIVLIPDQGDVPFNVAAVFLIRDGKIKEWTEYSF